MVKCPECKHEFSLRKPIPEGQACDYFCFDPATKKRYDKIAKKDIYYCDSCWKEYLRIKKQTTKESEAWYKEYKKARHENPAHADKMMEDLGKIN